MCVEQAPRAILVRSCLGNWCAVVLVVAVAGTVPGVGLVQVVAEVGAGGAGGWCGTVFVFLQVVQTLWNLIMKNSISGSWIILL